MLLIIVAVAVGVAWGQTPPAASQDFANIYLANRIVARIRGAGPYASLDERAKAVNAAIDKAITGRDVTQPVVTVQQKDGLWWVYAWDTPIISALPSEAAGNNNISPKSLAAVWAQNLKVALPLSKQTGAGAAPGTAAPPAETPAVVAPTTPTETPVETPPAGSTTVTVPAPAEPTTGAPPTAIAPPSTTPGTSSASGAAPSEPPVVRSAAILLILDSFRVLRALPDDEYQAKRDALASNLLANIGPFVTGSSSAAVTPTVVAPKPAPKPTPTPVVRPKPVTPTPAVKPTPKPVAPATAGATKPAPKPAPVAGVPAGREADPSYAKVAQKVRIRNKLAEAQTPYNQLKQSDPELAKTVSDLLKQTRDAFAVGKFDEAEGFVDEALGKMQTSPGQ
jgi:hypothetical protein